MISAKVITTDMEVVDSEYQRQHRVYEKEGRELCVGEPRRQHFAVTVNSTPADCYINFRNVDNTPRIYIVRNNDSPLPPEPYSLIEDAVSRAICEYITTHTDCFADELVDYAENMIKAVKEIERLCVENDFNDFKWEIDHSRSVWITPCIYTDEKRIEDVEFYLIRSNDLYGDTSIWNVANTLINAPAIIKACDDSRNTIVEYYVKKILPVDFIPYVNLSEDMKDITSYFSDWHKDCFGYRPHSHAENGCLQAFMSRGKTERDYVDYVRKCNNKGLACPVSFEAFEDCRRTSTDMER